MSFKKEKLGKRYNKSEVTQSYLMISPMIIGFSLFTLYPLILIVKWSFTNYTGFGTPEFVGLENYIRTFTQDPNFWEAILVTFQITIAKLGIGIPLALVIAVLISTKSKINTVLRTVYFVPSIISISVIGLIFYILFEPYRGIVNQMMINSGMIERSLPWFSNPTMAKGLVSMASIWNTFGIDMVLILTGLLSIDKSIYECAQIDGANRAQQFFKITIPMLAPVLQVVVLMAMLNAMKITDLVLVLTNGQPGGKTEVVMTYIYKYFFTGELSAVQQYGYASSMSVVTAIILGIITVFYLKSSAKKTEIY